MSDSEDDNSSVFRSKLQPKPKTNTRLKTRTVLSDDDDDHENSSPHPRMSRMSLRAKDSDAEQSLKAMMDIDDGVQVFLCHLDFPLNSCRR